MAKITINIEDEQLRKFQAVCEKLHVTPETAISLIIKAVAMTGGTLIDRQNAKKENTGTNNASAETESQQQSSLLEDILKNTVSNFLKDKGINVNADQIPLNAITKGANFLKGLLGKNGSSSSGSSDNTSKF